MAGQKTATAVIETEDLKIDGDISALATLANLFDQFERRFPLVTLRPEWK